MLPFTYRGVLSNSFLYIQSEFVSSSNGTDVVHISSKSVSSFNSKFKGGISSYSTKYNKDNDKVIGYFFIQLLILV